MYCVLSFSTCRGFSGGGKFKIITSTRARAVAVRGVLLWFLYFPSRKLYNVAIAMYVLPNSASLPFRRLIYHQATLRS